MRELANNVTQQVWHNQNMLWKVYPVFLIAVSWTIVTALCIQLKEGILKQPLNMKLFQILQRT